MTSIMKKIMALGVFCALTLPLLSAAPAEAGIGGGIGITFPVSPARGAGQNSTYAGVRYGDISEELTAEEKHGRLYLKLTVTNEGTAPYHVAHPTGQNYDFALLDAKGRTIWRWSDDMSFTQALQTYTLAPGASEEFTTEIDSKTYRTLKEKAVLVVAGLTDTDLILSAEVPEVQTGGRRPTLIHGDIIFGRSGRVRW